MSEFKVGDDHPVWWNTERPMVNGFYPARILEVKPYTGPLPFVRCILKLEAPSTKRGWIEMSITA
jgi:hypothetical protein